MNFKREYNVVAYGSNLNADDWEQYCYRNNFSSNCLEFKEVVRIPDYQLTFDKRSRSRHGGVANIRPALGYVVEAVLFTTNEEGLNILRRKEGCPRVYEERELVAIKSDGTEVSTKAYIVPQSRSEGYVKPSRSYYEVCKKGYASYGLSQVQLEQAANGEKLTPLSALFTYGTLMRGESRHHTIADADMHKRNTRCALTGKVKGCLTTNGDFPGLQLQKGGVSNGDWFLFENIEKILRTTDQIEGFQGFGAKNNFFTRTCIEVDTGGFEPSWAWVYVHPKSLGYPITSNDWRMHHRTKLKFFHGLIETYGQFDPFLGGLRENLTPMIEKYQRNSEQLLFSHLEQMLYDETLMERDLARATGFWNAWPKDLSDWPNPMLDPE